MKRKQFKSILNILRNYKQFKWYMYNAENEDDVKIDIDGIKFNYEVTRNSSQEIRNRTYSIDDTYLDLTWFQKQRFAATLQIISNAEKKKEEIIYEQKTDDKIGGLISTLENKIVDNDDKIGRLSITETKGGELSIIK